MKSEEELLQKAKEYAFLLLKFRLRSEKEICARLKQKKFPEPVIQKTLTFLKEKEFLNDTLFAKSWIESRLKKPFGLRRIIGELNLKGLDKEIIAEEIQQARQGYSEEDVVCQLARQRLSKLKQVAPESARRRLFAYLMRRGFSPDVVSEAINSLIKR